MTTDSSGPSTPSTGKLVFLALGLVVGASSGAAVAWVVQTRARNAYEARLAAMGEEAQPASRAPHSGQGDLDKTARAGIERGWAGERKDALRADEVNAGLAQCGELLRSLAEKIGADMARNREKSASPSPR